ncbi:hypothetical protein [Methylobacterium sp. WL9]|uniref:hypothetical protein n=1 Tax=Methylobacterium sp. WL9 TaxID=2603898 RepID=UPI0011CA18F0|nr:hypothetical protein [Methylobacterium sp. WL9]TXN23177.1 hypothetical protein FV217_07665 [Methylobacterium sp. WL9]
MSKTISAEFETRRDAEMAVERLVQEYGLDRSSVRIVAASDENTAGTQAAGADLEGGQPKTETAGEPALNGKVKVSADVAEASADKVVSSFEGYGGSSISS